MHEQRIHLVANSHIDPVWLWDRQEGIDEVLNTFRSACDRLDEYSDLKFTASSACFYQWLEEHAPDIFDRVRQFVQQRRWEVVGGWWVEMDCNLPTAASFRASAAISRRYLWSRLAAEIPVAFSPDTFGHPATLPALLSDSGFRYYVFSRPSAGEMPHLPADLFYWERDGKRVLCYRLRYHYSQGYGNWEGTLDRALSDDVFLQRGLACYLFGVGDHGGGPARAEIEMMKRRMSQPGGEGLVFSTLLDFFREAEKLPDIPVYSGDLHYHAVGCYSVNRALKDAVRRAERRLEFTDRVLSATGQTADLTQAWQKVLFNQFHDILPGSCVPQAAAQAMDEVGSALDDSSRIAYGALKNRSRAIPVRRKEGEFRVFNSLPYDVTVPVEIESFFYYHSGVPFRDASGRQVPIQEMPSQAQCYTARWMFVDTLPARGYATYSFDTDAIPGPPSGPAAPFISGNEIAQGSFRAEAPGMVVNTAFGEHLFAAPLRLGVQKDESDTWGHAVRGFGPSQRWFQQESCAVRPGILAANLFSRQSLGGSWAELLYTVYRDLPWVDLKLRVFWAEERSILKLDIQPRLGVSPLVVQGPGGAIDKSADGAEEPLHGWLKSPRLGILQDGAFAFDRVGETLRITLIRSSLYSYDGSWQLDPCGPLNHTDQGLHEFRLRFIPEDLPLDEMDRQFAAFVEPFPVIRENS